MEYDPIIDYGEKDLSIEQNLVCWKFSELIKTLIIVSSPAEKQIEYIGIGAAADEMANDLDTYYTLSFQSYIDYKLINSKQKEKLDDLDHYFEVRSGAGNPEFWDDNLLRTNPEWEIARQKAKEILISLDKENYTIEYDREEKCDKNGRVILQTTKTRLAIKNARTALRN